MNFLFSDKITIWRKHLIINKSLKDSMSWEGLYQNMLHDLARTVISKYRKSSICRLAFIYLFCFGSTPVYDLGSTFGYHLWY